ncbi:MAG TPA: F0F1 ATP synthase subunit delta [Micromonosporaceae bacterium]
MDPSRVTYLAAVERLNSLARSVGAARLASIADDLLAVAMLLEKQPGLRRALTDPSRSGEDRAGLLDSLLESRMAEDARSPLRVLVAGRWSSGSELLTTVERLAVEALLASADAAHELIDVEDELFRFGQVVEGNPGLSAALGSSTTPAEQRSRLVHSLLANKARPVTTRLVDVALRGFGGRSFDAGLARLVELAADRRDRAIAYVTVARTLSQEQQRRLADQLSSIYGRTVDLKISVSPEVVGGLRVRIGDDLYDATILRRLAEARVRLVGRAS